MLNISIADKKFLAAMTFHVGINPSILYGLLYNTSNGETTEFELKFDYVYPGEENSILNYLTAWSDGHLQPFSHLNEFDCIKEMFENIKTKITGKLGCVCIVMEKFDNESRKSFIKTGLEAGFEKVEIIDPFTALYLHTTFFSKYVPKENDVVGIIINNSCYLWKQLNKKAKFIECVIGNFDVEEYIVQFLTNWKFAKAPNVILCCESNKGITEALSVKYNLFAYRFQDFTYSLQFIKVCLMMSRNAMVGINKGSILYARMMANDLPSENYDIQKVLDRQIILKMSRKIEPAEKRILATIESQQELPLKCIIKINNKSTRKQKLHIEGEYMTIFVPSMVKLSFRTIKYFEAYKNEGKQRTAEEATIDFSEVIHQKCENYILVFSIDSNGIYRVEFSEGKPKNFSTIEEFFENCCSTSINKSIKIEELLFGKSFADEYFIPKDVFKNDPSIDAVGIDLGTTRCCAAVNRINGIQTVQLDNTGERLLPSYVAFDEDNEKCGKLVVNRLRFFSKSTVFDSKRIIGKSMEDITEDKSWGFEIVNVNQKVKIQLKGPNGTITKHPEEISSALLKHVKRKTEEFQNKTLSEAVITVPAAFNEAQKDSTYAAALVAGWEKVHLLPEPTAAAFAYFANRPIPNNSTVLLFDLGGGTLDVCIFKIIKGNIQIIGRTGDPNLGGRDFDNILINYFSKKLKEMFNVILNEDKKCKLMLECQEVKHTLSGIADCTFDVSDFDPSKAEYISITRVQFEDLSKNLLEKIQTCITKVLDETSFTANEMDKVLYVGGGCRMPMIKKLLHDTFFHAEHCCEEHPDEVVAIGAAYYSYYLASKKEDKCSIM